MKNIRLYIICEGQTEQKFTKDVLSEYLSFKNITVIPSCIITSKDKRQGKIYRGGFSKYFKAREDILIRLKENKKANCRFSTMFDYYGLPNDFPGVEESKRIADPYERIAFLEESLLIDIDDPRFIPYIQLHEFETLIFADPGKLDAEYFDREEGINALCTISKEFGGNPELINNNRETAPSKRILKQIPEFDKANIGPIIASLIGLDKLRLSCRHFNDWITKLENLHNE